MVSKAGHIRTEMSASHADGADLLKIAQVLKSNGTDGELVLGFRGVSPDDISIGDPVFIFFDGLPVPFFIESLVRKGTSKALVRLTGIRSFLDAEEFAGQSVYAEASAVESSADDDFSSIVGWSLYDRAGDRIGEIAGYMDIPGNPCIEVALTASSENEKPREVMIPLHEDLVISADAENRELRMDIPEGLM